MSKIAFVLVLALLTASCNTVKRVGNTEKLLTKNTVYINQKANNTEAITNLVYQKPNRKLLGIPIRLHIYNLARPNIDSILEAKINKTAKRRNRLERLLSKKQLTQYINSRKGFNSWLQNTGEAPTIINKDKTERTINRLEAYYFHNGWFNAKATAKTVAVDSSRVKVDYHVQTGKPYIVDTLSVSIASPAIDSLYQAPENKTLIEKNTQYKTATFEQEKTRLTNYFRNNGVYHFKEDYVYFEMDTIRTGHKVKVDLQIQDRLIKNDDSTTRKPFEVYTIKDVNIFTEYDFLDKQTKQQDTLQYKGYTIFSPGKLRFRPKTLTDAVFITPDSTFRDMDRTLSYRYISELRTFKYPNIEYIENTDNTLTANVYLNPKKKFGLEFSAEVSQSNIQTIGFSLNPSVLMRNVFGGAETLQLTGFGSIGASKDAANDQDRFFDITEWGADLKLTIPRLLLPFNTDKLIPKSMSPTTRMSIATSSQRNIGLDKQNLTGTLNYRWKPNFKVTNRVDLFSVQYVKSLNPSNYFNVYSTAYNTLNNIAQSINYINPNTSLGIPEEANSFIQEALSNNPPFGLSVNNIQNIRNINERKERLTENNLIIASSYSYVRDNRTNLFDENFSIFRGKIESAGNLLSLASNMFGTPKNANDNFEIFDVAYSQYLKTELDYVKRWDLGKKQVLAFRGFFGIAIPYGNSNSIPFSKSFFAGGTNDNRAWTAYSLGPGSSDSNDEFNEANMKLAFNLEYRFNIFGDFYGAVFADAGNIWNALDNIEDPQATFTNLNSLQDIALGSGFGLRYDFGFVIFRFDTGFKTYDPSYQMGNRWFNDYNFTNAVYNIGINYPF
ncbi:BamA/TamA family outer membrane protein [Bizionia sediminis]|uniref:BamA/TamA family outer membrane protein n=1 Tax=Bizionia sediminis TaxID=1737064 RepID=A0ABW5KSD7_9FLAO